MDLSTWTGLCLECSVESSSDSKSIPNQRKSFSQYLILKLCFVAAVSKIVEKRWLSRQVCQQNIYSPYFTIRFLSALSKKDSRKRSKIPYMWPGNTPQNKQGGRTVTIDTVKGKKKVFIPKGFLFCTISPLKCYSSRNTKRKLRIFLCDRK